MSDVYSGSDISSAFNASVSPNEHLPEITFDNQDSFENADTYADFGYTILGDNKLLSKGAELSVKMIESRAQKADKLGLVGQAWGNYVEGVESHVTSKANDANSSLVPPAEDKVIQAPSSPNTGTTLIDVLKQSATNQGSIMENMVVAFDHVSTMLQNQNAIQKQLNEIMVESNKIQEFIQASDSAKADAMVKGFMSIAQSLEYIPTLIETLQNASDRQLEIGNTTNEHLLQKNVNDAYGFKWSKTDENGSNKALNRVADSLASSATHQSKMAKHSDLKVAEIEEENESWYKEMLIDPFVDQFSDFDIFSWLLENTTSEEVTQ